MVGPTEGEGPSHPAGVAPRRDVAEPDGIGAVGDRVPTGRGGPTVGDLVRVVSRLVVAERLAPVAVDVNTPVVVEAKPSPVSVGVPVTTQPLRGRRRGHWRLPRSPQPPPHTGCRPGQRLVRDPYWDRLTPSVRP